MSIGLRADAGGTSGAVTINGADKLVITNAGNITATTFTGALVGNADTATKFAGTTGTAPVYGVRAWVTFNGNNNSSNVYDLSNTNRYLYGSGNISNVLRNGTGDYTIYFSISMSDANYCVVPGASINNNIGSGWVGHCHINSGAGAVLNLPATNAFRIAVTNYNTSGMLDPSYVSVLVIG